MNIHESAEDYLERILMIKEEKGHVHAIDIANDLNFSRASVSHAMKLLKENGYIDIDEKGNITLLDSGKIIAQRILHRHRILTALFIHMGINPNTAEKDACKIEHDLSEETFLAMEKHIASLKLKL